MINEFKRYQTGLVLEDLFPSMGNVCACGCNRELPKGKKKWYSKECQIKALYQFYIIKGDVSFIRKSLFMMDKGFCRCCGQYDENWQADHIIPVSEGGGACDLSNFQTICTDCHLEKTLNAIPYRRYIRTTCFNITYSPLRGIRTNDSRVCKNVVRYTVGSLKRMCYSVATGVTHKIV